MSVNFIYYFILFVKICIVLASEWLQYVLLIFVYKNQFFFHSTSDINYSKQVGLINTYSLAGAVLI